jgi:hypothetical protein
MAGAWLLMRRGNLLMAGVLIGLIIAVKPNYALVALLLLAAGHYRPALTAGATAGLVSLVPLVIDGPGIYKQWLQLTMAFDGYTWTSNASMVALAERLQVPPAGEIAGVLLTMTLVVFARRLRPGPLDASALGIMAVILVGPVSWAGYTLLLVPYLFSIRWDGRTWASLALFAVPFAPDRAFAALGFDVAGMLSGPAASASTAVPSALLATAGAVVMPLVSVVYGWATFLLMVRLMKRISAEDSERRPAARVRRKEAATTPQWQQMRRSAPAFRNGYDEVQPALVHVQSPD